MLITQEKRGQITAHYVRQILPSTVIFYEPVSLLLLYLYFVCGSPCWPFLVRTGKHFTDAAAVPLPSCVCSGSLWTADRTSWEYVMKGMGQRHPVSGSRSGYHDNITATHVACCFCDDFSAACLPACCRSVSVCDVCQLLWTWVRTVWMVQFLCVCLQFKIMDLIMPSISYRLIYIFLSSNFKLSLLFLAQSNWIFDDIFGFERSHAQFVLLFEVLFLK